MPSRRAVKSAATEKQPLQSLNICLAISKAPLNLLWWLGRLSEGIFLRGGLHAKTPSFKWPTEWAAKHIHRDSTPILLVYNLYSFLCWRHCLKRKTFIPNYCYTIIAAGGAGCTNHFAIRLSNIILAYRGTSGCRNRMEPNSAEVKVSLAMGNWFLRDRRLGKVFSIPVWPHERVRADNAVQTEFKFAAI